MSHSRCRGEVKALLTLECTSSKLLQGLLFSRGRRDSLCLTILNLCAIICTVAAVEEQRALCRLLDVVNQALFLPLQGILQAPRQLSQLSVSALW